MPESTPEAMSHRVEPRGQKGGVMSRDNSRLAGLTVGVLLAVAPAFAEVRSVVFKTTNKKVGFL